MRFFFGHIHFSLRFGLTIRPSSSPSFRSPTIYYCAPDTILTKGKTLRLVESKGLAAERWPSAAARDQHSSREEKGYLRSMLSRRQLQAIVRRRHIQRSFSASTSMILPTGAAHAAQLKILYVDQCGNQQSVGPPEKSRMRATYFPHPVAISLILGDCLRVLQDDRKNLEGILVQHDDQARANNAEDFCPESDRERERFPLVRGVLQAWSPKRYDMRAQAFRQELSSRTHANARRQRVKKHLHLLL
jgi:hypothetical protein